MEFDNFLHSFQQNRFFSVKQVQHMWKYWEVLELLASRQNVTILEIGVAGGGSLHFYREILGPKARIIGVDLNPACKELELFGFEIMIGNQGDEKFLESVRKRVGSADLVIDDGGHTNWQQIQTVKHLIDIVNDGGFYFVEDTQASYHTRFGNPSKYSTIEWLKRQVDVIASRNLMTSIPNEKTSFSDCVYSIEFMDALVVLLVNRSRCINGNEIVSAGERASYLRDYRYEQSRALTFLYQLSKSFETGSPWKGKFSGPLNHVISRVSLRAICLSLIKYGIRFLSSRAGKNSKSLFHD